MTDLETLRAEHPDIGFYPARDNDLVTLTDPKTVAALRLIFSYDDTATLLFDFQEDGAHLILRTHGVVTGANRRSVAREEKARARYKEVFGDE